MRKLTLLLAALMLLLTTWSAAALPTAELTTLARYAPADAAAFASVRSDEAYVETLNTLLEQLGEGFAPLGALSVDFVLDQAVSELSLSEDDDFESLIRPWLGETVAVAVLDDTLLSETASPDALRLLISVSDNAAAEAFLDGLEADYDKTEVDGALLYSNADSTLLLHDDALIIAPAALQSPDMLLSEASDPLADSADFQTTLDGLPETDYNAAVYIQPADLLVSIVPDLQESLDEVGMNIDIAAALDALGPQALGLTILEERSLVLDVAASIADPDALAAAGLPQNPSVDPLELDFLSNVPAGTPLVLQNRGFGTALLDSLDQTEMLGDMFDEQFELGILSFDQQALTQVDDLVTFTRLAFQGMAGLTLEDAFGWMSADYALFLDLDVQSAERILPIVGLVASGTDGAAATLDGFENLFVELDLFAERTGDTLTIPALGDLFADDDLDIILSAENGLFQLGTRSAFVEGDTLLDMPSYETASSVFLPDTQTLAYIDMLALSDRLVELGNALGDANITLAAQVLKAFESASITAVYDETGNGVVRFVLTTVATE